MPGRIVIISGPPGAGKTSLARALAERGGRTVCVPVDEVREWVVSGVAHPVPDWTDETARQFTLAEDGAADIALRYAAAGFDVFLDHCRLPENIEAWANRSFGGQAVSKVAIVPSLDTNLERNRSRLNKNFDPSVLEPVIQSVNAAYGAASLEGWLVVRGDDGPEDALAWVTSSLGL